MPVDHQTQYQGIIIRLRDASESVHFPAIVDEALRMIASKPVGKQLLENIAGLSGRAKFGYTVCISRPSDMRIINGNWCMANRAVRGDEAKAMKADEGSVTAIYFNANIISTPDGDRPTFIGLAHELIHAYYNLKGEALRGPNEELATVGIGTGPQRTINENAIRAEHGLPLRSKYTGV
jgi:hypothetical protein